MLTGPFRVRIESNYDQPDDVKHGARDCRGLIRRAGPAVPSDAVPVPGS
jgi:hypothetical protein